jgi:hypothetical protein
MSGRVTEGYVAEPEVDDRILYYYRSDGPSSTNLTSEGQFVSLAPLVTGFYGPEISFGRSIHAQSNNPIAIIKISDGGTSLAGEWNSRSLFSNRMWKHWLSDTTDAIQDLKNMGFTPILRGICWLQGESDAFVIFNAHGYRENFLNLVNDMFEHLEPQLDVSRSTFVTARIGELADFMAHADTVRSAQAQVMNQDPNWTYFDTTDLTLFDYGHFDAESVAIIGERFAAEFAQQNRDDLSAVYPQLYPEGANMLFAGHSFYVPVAMAFNVISESAELSSYGFESVFSSGTGGAPGMLWTNEENRQKIIDVLETQEVEVFGMTSVEGFPISFEDYSQWFDLALSYNPGMHFFIGVPWSTRGPAVETSVFRQRTIEYGDSAFEVVEQLREAYPDNRISFLNYGMVAVVMKEMFDEGSLPDIEAMVPDVVNGVAPAKALFSDDSIGHAGPVLTELSAYTWAALFYGAHPESFESSDFETDIVSIIEAVMEYNVPYQQVID